MTELESASHHFDFVGVTLRSMLIHRIIVLSEQTDVIFSMPILQEFRKGIDLSKQEVNVSIICQLTLTPQVTTAPLFSPL